MTKEERREYDRKWVAENPDKVIAKKLKWRVKFSEEEFKEYFRKTSAKWRINHREEYLESGRRNVSSTNKKRKLILDKLKEGLGCARCPEWRAEKLGFHHIAGNANKEFSIGLAGTLATERIIEEIQKCIVLCKSCHLKLHRPLMRNKGEIRRAYFI